MDIIAINNDEDKVTFIECKWSKLSLQEIEKILKNLRDKSHSVKWKKSKRQEKYGIIAKNLERKDQLREKQIFALDIDDLNWILENNDP